MRFGRVGGAWLCAALLILAISLAGCASAPVEGATAVKLIVEHDGLYKVSARELAAAGFDLAGAPRDALSLTVGGAAAPFELIGDGKETVLSFTGLSYSADAYTTNNVYWLRSDATSPAPAAPAPQPSPTPHGNARPLTRLRLEKDLQYDTLAADAADRWHWQTLFAPTSYDIPFTVSQLGAGPGEVSVYVVAKSSAPVDPDHRLLISINGTLVSDAPWDGIGPRLIADDIPDGILKEGENTLTIAAPGDTGAAADLTQLHWVEIGHPSTAAAAEPAAQQVAAILPAQPGSLPDWEGGADLVIVTAPELRAALTPLVEARVKQGLRVAVLDVEQVYDAFSYGRTDPVAIQSLMRHARENWPAPAPRYLLLAGDASYDPLDRKQGAEKDVIPTRAVRTTYSGWTGSDVWYALPDDGPTTLPAFAVGRFPAQNAEQLATMVSKTLAYTAETGDLSWRSKALLVADNDESGFAEATAAFANRLEPYAAELVTLDGDGANARAAFERAFAEGAGLVGYFGHGSVTLWAKENVFDVERVAGLRNDRLPIVFTVTCLSGFFEDPTTVSLGESLLRHEQGGAVAALVPSSAAVLPDQTLLADGLAAALAQPAGRALGDIVLDAQRSLPEQEGGVREILLTFNLLGDPSLTVGR